MKYVLLLLLPFFLFAVDKIELDSNIKLKIKNLRGIDYGLPNLDGKKLKKYLDTEASASGLKRMSQKQIEAIPVAPTLYGPIPNSVDLSNLMPPVDNQGSKGSCAAWAGGYYLASYHQNKSRGWSTDTKEHIMSPAFIYNHKNGNGLSPCERPNYDEHGNFKNYGSGMYLDEVAKILKNKGIVPWDIMPYSKTNGVCPYPTSEQEKQAKSYRIKSFKWVYGLNNFRKYLAKGNPIYIGILLSTEFDDFYRDGEILSIMPGAPGSQTISCTKDADCSTNGGSMTCNTRANICTRGAHAILVTGYNKTNDTFTIVNSWGTGWGSRSKPGYLMIKSNVFEALLDGYLGVKGLIYTPMKTCTNSCEPDSYSCDGQFLKKCIDSNSDGCFETVQVRDCGAHQCNANAAKCEVTCNDECTLGATRCSPTNSGVEQICARNEYGCKTYITNKTCSSCQNGKCNNSGGTCTNECSTLGEEKCKGTRVLTCKTASNSCLKYLPKNICGSGYTCDASKLNNNNDSDNCMEKSGMSCQGNPNSLSSTPSSNGFLYLALFALISLVIIRRKNKA